METLGQRKTDIRDSLVMSTLISLATDNGTIRYTIRELCEILERNGCLSRGSKYSECSLKQILNRFEQTGMIVRVSRLENGEIKQKRQWSGHHYYYQISDWEQAARYAESLPKIPLAPRLIKEKVRNCHMKKLATDQSYLGKFMAGLSGDDLDRIQDLRSRLGREMRGNENA